MTRTGRTRLCRWLCTTALAGLVLSTEAGAQFSTLNTFNEGTFTGRGVDSVGVLTSDSAGNLYGTTTEGIGSFCGTFIICGSVFKLTKSAGGTYTYGLVYGFQGGADGGHPRAGVLIDPAGSGNLYGTSFDGGALGTSACGAAGCGTVFVLNSSGTMVWKYQFVGGSDGASPHANLTFDSQGDLYGTTSAGGGGSCTTVAPPNPGPGYQRVNGCGTVFKLTPAGTNTFQETVLYVFKGGTDGANPYSNPIFDAAGNAYGTTAGGGGTGCGGAGCGTVFELTPGGTETVLYRFAGGADGAFPYAGLISDGTGHLYGTTSSGGGTGCGGAGCGTVFKLTSNGNGTFSETVLYSFAGGTDGATPFGGLAFDTPGNLYGTTRNGGNAACTGNVGPGYGSGCGTLFEISPTGTETILYSFTGGADGDNPYAGLFYDGGAGFYGSTQFGASGMNCAPLEYEPTGCGTVFELTIASLAHCTDNSGGTVPVTGKQYVPCPAGQVGTSACPSISPVVGPGLPNCATETCVAANTWSTPPDNSLCSAPCTDNGKTFWVGQTETQNCPGGQAGTQTRTCNAGGSWGAWAGACQCPSGQLLCRNLLTQANQCVTPLGGITDSAGFHSWCGHIDSSEEIDCSSSCPAGVKCGPAYDNPNHLQTTDLYCGDGSIGRKTGGGSDVALVTYLALMAVWAGGVWHRRRGASR